MKGSLWWYAVMLATLQMRFHRKRLLEKVKKYFKQHLYIDNQLSCKLKLRKL